MFSIVVMSCDKYKCLTPAFKHCIDKYYPNHPEIYFIYGQGCWTERLRKGLEQIQDEYVLFFLDDMLIREPVNKDLINNAFQVLQKNDKIAVINFEHNYREALSFSNYWLKQKQNQFYLHSCQPSLWNRKAFINNLQKNEDAWTWELTTVNNNYTYLINKDANIINIGKRDDLNWGISRGTMSKEFQDFLIKENIYSDEIQDCFSPYKISIITPYYRTLNYIQKLANVLEPQLTDDIEWIVVDDGCNEKELDKLKAKVIHLEKNSGGGSVPRNIGLDHAQGQYILFIDSDDLVTSNYISTIVNKINNEGHTFNYCYISWTSEWGDVIIENEPPATNTSIWNCIYKKSEIGNERFNPEIIIGEDYDFNLRVRKGTHGNITDILYIYNTTVPNSLTKGGWK